MKYYAPIVLRIAIAGVYAWFGTSQLVNSGAWTGFVPTYATGWFGMSAATIVHINGALELTAALLLALGLFVRPVAFVLFAHLMAITASLGLTAIAVRDCGLTFATLSVALWGKEE